MARRKSLTSDLIDFTVASAIGGAAVGVLGASGTPLAGPTSSLVGVALLSEGGKLATKKHKRLF